MCIFSSAVPIEGVHPLQAGFLRLKFRSDRRPGLPIEPVWAFYPKYGGSWCRRASVSAYAGCEHGRACGARRERNRQLTPYMDQAITPVAAAETETLEMFTHNAAARNQVAHIRKVAELTSGKARAPHQA